MTSDPVDKDPSELRAELQDNLDEAEWAWLAPFAKRDAVILLAPELELVDTGVKFALDDKIAVAAWLEKGLLGRPSAEQLRSWDKDPKRKFMILVVQPYVLAQERVYH